MQMREATLVFVKFLILFIPFTATLTDGLSEVTPSQLLAWPDDSYDRYIAVDKAAINEFVDENWIENGVGYLDESVEIAKVDCTDDVTDICQLLREHHVVLLRKDSKDQLLPLKSLPANGRQFIRALLELQADGLHVSCETTDQVEIIAKNSGALVTLVTDTEHQEYLKYLGGLPPIGKRLQRPLITVFTTDAIPSKKRPKRLVSLHIWFVVTIGNQPQWLPMGRDKNNDDVITSILNFISPLRYPILHEYHPTDTPGLLRDSDINVVYVLMTPDHRESSPMETIVSLAKKNIGQFSFVTADFDKYGLNISDVQLPEQLEEFPYIIIQPKNYDQLVHASPKDVPFEYDLLDDLLRSVAKRGFEREPGYDEPEVKDIPLQDDLITLDNVRTLKDLIGVTEHYILAGFCSKRSTGCNKLAQLLSPIASVASRLHDNLGFVIVECRPTDQLPGGLLINHLPSVAFFDYTDKSWTEYRAKKSLEGINDFLSEVIELNDVESDDGEKFDEAKFRQDEFVRQLLSEFATVEEDDQMGLLANRLGAANITNTPQLTDTTIGSFISQHKTAIVTFYQKWCVQSKVFLHHVVPLQHQLSAKGVAVVSCSDWPDVCANHNITTYPTVLIFKGSEAIWYRGHMSAKSIIASLPYYTAPIVQQLNPEGESVEDFITNCTRSGLAGVVGIFPDEVSPSYHQFLSTAAHYHGRRLFGVLVTSEVPEDLPVEVTKLPVVFMVDGRGPQLVADPEQLETTLLSANELTPETLPYYFSVKKPLLVLVVNEETNFHPLVELAASHYPLVTWMNYDRYGGIVERYLSTCSQPPVLLVFDFSAGVVYHGNQCGEHLSPKELETFINLFENGKLTPVAHFESKQWKPVAEPFVFPSPDDPPPNQLADFDDNTDDNDRTSQQTFDGTPANHQHAEL